MTERADASSASDAHLFMDLESLRDLQLLDAVEQNSAQTQRTLSSRLGIALGLTNLYVKRLIRKGYIKSVTTRPNRLMYIITPRGLARKARLTMEFMEYSLDLFRDAREHVRRHLNGRVGRQKRVAIFGTGEAAELAFLVLREVNLEPAAIFDVVAGGRFLGMPVLDIATHHTIVYDTIIVGTLDKAKKTAQLLLRLGVPAEKLLLLRPDVAVPNSSLTRKADPGTAPPEPRA